MWYDVYDVKLTSSGQTGDLDARAFSVGAQDVVLNVIPSVIQDTQLLGWNYQRQQQHVSVLL